MDTHLDASLPATVRTPLARATRLNLVEREVRERLTAAGIERLLAKARVLSEGSRARALPLPGGSRGPDPYFGSTMLTIELADLASEVRETVEPALVERLAALLAVDARATRRMRRLAEDEAARLAGGRLASAVSELRVRAVGTAVHVDVDLEGAAPATAATGKLAGRAG